MKNTFLFLIMMALCFACQKDESIGPRRLLYQRWLWIESRSANGSVYRPDQTRPTIITFKPWGEYVYEYNSKQFTCCQPNRFVRQGNQLSFSDVAGGYVSPECSYMLCVSYQPEKIIDSLSAQRLVLSVKGSTGQTIYQAVP